MLTSQKLLLESSEARQTINEILALETQSDEDLSKLSKLQKRMSSIEVEYRAAVAAESDIATSSAAAPDAENRERRDLIDRASIGEIFSATLEHRSTDGATAELQTHLKLPANAVPLDLLMEHRAVTPAPSNVGQNQSAIIPAVFPESCASWLGIDMPRVATGEAVYPVLTTSATVHVPAENASAADTTGAFSAELLSSKRLQAAFFYSREDRARFAGMDSALRENLGMALMDKLDQQVLAGTNGLFTGTNLANNTVSSVTDFGDYKADLAFSRVDGRYAMTPSDLKILLGSATFAHAATRYRANNSDDSALDVLQMKTGGTKVSAHVPAAAANKQNSVVRLGMRRDMVAPIWEGITLIPDEITKAATGQIVITAVMLHAVKILRAAGFYKQQSQHA